ncbi:MAG: glycoside hydrolase family 97 N-terminal domain-containing protein, partial [Bacteroidales bacterium]|nr:glycoside hydrolase family 97 N-terminal domain-containing protein [Bacteroidales bacterium]
MKRILVLAAALCGVLSCQVKDCEIASPNGEIKVKVEAGEKFLWSVSLNGNVLLEPSEIALVLDDGTVYGGGAKMTGAVHKKVNRTLPAQNFKRAQVVDKYNQITLCSKDFDLVFRVYDDGAAYRFVTKKGVTVVSEKAEFAFPSDNKVWASYVRTEKPWHEQFYNSFENLYSIFNVSEWERERLAFLPVTLSTGDGVKLCITESDLLNYPGMYLSNPQGDNSLEGVYAPYPKDIEQGDHNMLQGVVRSREPFIYKGDAGEALPWRVVIVAKEDRQLTENDMVWRLARPAEGDFSWVRPGKVAWEWWNDWNIRGVPFQPGVNNDTYKYYIDFASANGIEYVILDEGWAVNLQADLFQVVPEIDLPELCAYAAERNVRLVLWAGYWAFSRDMEAVCEH